MARTMLNDSKHNDIFWVQVVHTIVHILNTGLLRNNSDQTPYGIWKGRTTNVKHFIFFGSKCYIKREDKKIGKFDSRVDEGIFVGYSWNNNACRCYNLKIKKIVESINVKIDESILLKTKKEIKNPDILKDQKDIELKQEKEEDEEEGKQDEKYLEVEQGDNQQNLQTPSKTLNYWVQKNHPPEHIIGDKSVRMETKRRQVQIRK